MTDIRFPNPRLLRRTLLAAWLLFASLLSAGTERPNILFIALDDLSDVVSILDGHPQAHTPNLDRLASMGMNFTRAYVPSPVCNSSRAALMTGRHPFVTGITRNGQPARETYQQYGTLSLDFLNAGYYTAGSGKILHRFFFPEGHWTEVSERFSWPDVPREDRIEIGGEFDNAGVLPDHLEPETGDYQTVEWVAERLRQEHAQPFFLAAGIYRPHTPWQVPQRYFDMYPIEEIELPVVPPDELDDVPPAGRMFAYSSEAGGGGNPDDFIDEPERHPHRNIVESGHWERGVQTYLACVTYADAMLGRLLDALEESPHRDNTIIVMWSDHGWHLGEKHRWRKSALWEKTLRVPFVIVAPGVAEPGSTSERVVNLIDIYPTLLDLAGLPQTKELCGTSLRPLLENPTMDWHEASLSTYAGNNITVRTGQYRYIRYDDGSEELYDHSVDRNEWTNLAALGTHDEVLAHHRTLLPSHVKSVSLSFEDWPDAQTEWDVAESSHDGFTLSAWYAGEPALIASGNNPVPVGVKAIGFGRAINFDGADSEKLILSIPEENDNGKVAGLEGITFGSINGLTPDIVIISGFVEDPLAFEPAADAHDNPDSPFLSAPIHFDASTGTLTIRYDEAVEADMRPVRTMMFENPHAAPGGATLEFTQGTLSDGSGASSGDGYGLNVLHYRIASREVEVTQYLGWPVHESDDEEYVNTGTFLGRMHIEYDPWIYSEGLRGYLGIPSQTGTLNDRRGFWAFRPFDQPLDLQLQGYLVWPIASNGSSVDSGSWMGKLDIGRAPWVYSFSTGTYFKIAETAVDTHQNTGLWLYLPLPNPPQV